jgi:hypothetical protein
MRCTQHRTDSGERVKSTDCCKQIGEIFSKLLSETDQHTRRMNLTSPSVEARPLEARRIDARQEAFGPNDVDERPDIDEVRSQRGRRVPVAEGIRIVPWNDPLVDKLGYDPRSLYVEKYWLAILGPSSVWLLRNVARSLDESPDGFWLASELTARQIGLGARTGPNSPFQRSLRRLENFGLSRPVDRREMAVRRFLPPLANRHLLRLDPELREEHGLWFRARTNTDPALSRMRLRARRMALGLVTLGADYSAVENDLIEWRLHPALASDAIAWAWRRSGRGLQDGSPAHARALRTLGTQNDSR